MWTARKILKELADTDRRQKILTAFWKHGDQTARLQAEVELAEALKYRHLKIRKMPVEKKVQLLATRLGVRDFESHFETALVQYLTHDLQSMLCAFLDQWEIPHEDGMIEQEEVTPPTAEQTREAVGALDGQFEKADVAIYLASAGLMMGEKWQEAMWPVVTEIAPTSDGR